MPMNYNKTNDSYPFQQIIHSKLPPCVSFLGLAVYSHALDAGVRYPFDEEKRLTLLLC